MSEANATMSGAERAALLLMAIGTEPAAEVIKHMEPHHVQGVGSAMTELGDVTQTQLGGVLETFLDSVRDTSSLGTDSENYLRRVLHQALGQDRADSVLPRILTGSNSKGIESLRWMAPRDIAEILGKEHPQIISLALLNLGADAAADVLALFPDELRSDVMLRIATLDSVHPAALKELDEILEAQLGSNVELMVPGMGGVKAVAEILGSLPKEMESAVMDKLGSEFPELKEQIQDELFNFETLKDLDDRSMQSILREVSSDSLVLSLKGASSEMRDLIFRNMSSRAAELLRDDLEAKGPVRLHEVETAQKEILAVVNRLVEEGQIVLQGKGDDFV